MDRTMNFVEEFAASLDVAGDSHLLSDLRECF